MKNENRAHARFSASGANKWLYCPASVSLEEEHETLYGKTETSPAAAEGIKAHELAERCMNIASISGKDMSFGESSFTYSMRRHVWDYVDYVRFGPWFSETSRVVVEHKVDYSKHVKDGFGTADCGIMDYKNHSIHVFDLKYGKTKVKAKGNNQMKLYAIGLYDYFKDRDVQDFYLHIVQPRIDHYDKWHINRDDLLEFALFAKEKSILASEKFPKYIPGNRQCCWCRGRSICPAREKMRTDKILEHFSKL